MVTVVAFLHHRIWPDLPHKLVLLDQVSAVLNQCQQSVERFGGQGHSSAVAQEEVSGGVQSEWAELVDGSCLTSHGSFGGF